MFSFVWLHFQTSSEETYIHVLVVSLINFLWIWKRKKIWSFIHATSLKTLDGLATITYLIVIESYDLKTVFVFEQFLFHLCRLLLMLFFFWLWWLCKHKLMQQINHLRWLWLSNKISWITRKSITKWNAFLNIVFFYCYPISISTQFVIINLFRKRMLNRWWFMSTALATR